MGVIYKLKPEINNYILEKKRVDPLLSCRRLASLVEAKFKIKISKSSINSLIKQAGLSMPVGRRHRLRKGLIEADGLGAILLKAADYLVGGSYYITEVIKSRFKSQLPYLQAKTEALLYSPLFNLLGISLKTQLRPDFGLWSLVNHRFTSSQITSYLNELKQAGSLSIDILSIISAALQEVVCIKVSLSDDRAFYLDGQLHTVWSTPRIPYDFSSTGYNIKSYINKYLQEGSPFVLFMAPGYDNPIKEFFYFMLSLDSAGKQRFEITLYTDKLKELEVIKIEQAKRRFFVFGLWPWQFNKYRRVESLSEFKPFAFAPQNKDFYLAETTIKLSQSDKAHSITLRGAVLKQSSKKEPDLVILSSIPKEQASVEDIATLYLNHWPNLQETFQDFSRKIELFTYTASSQRFLSTQYLNLQREAGPGQDIEALFNHYLKALDLYVRWRFLPLGYEQKDFLSVREQFYNLRAKFKKKKDCLLVNFQPPSGYRFLKELEYVCRRVNEREVMFNAGKRLWFSAT